MTQIRTDSNGKCIHVTKEYSIGDIIIKETPIVYMPLDSSFCTVCLNSIASMRCSKCQNQKYCSIKCQSLDWKNHKNECGFLQKAPRNLGATLRCISRILTQSSILLPKTLEFKSHKNDYPLSKIEEFGQMILCMHPLLCDESISPSTILDLLCRFGTHATTIHNDELCSIGIGLYPTVSFVTHSCSPNAVMMFNGAQVILKCIQPLSTNTEITISYIDLLACKQDRSIELNNRYFFNCDCPSCSLEQESEEIMTCMIIKSIGLRDEIQSCIDKEDFSHALQLCIQLKPFYEQVYCYFHPNTTILCYKIFKLSCLMCNQKEIVEVAMDACKRLSVSHGMDSEFYKHVKGTLLEMGISSF